MHGRHGLPRLTGRGGHRREALPAGRQLAPPYTTAHAVPPVPAAPAVLAAHAVHAVHSRRQAAVCTTPPPHAAPPCWLPVSPPCLPPQAHETKVGVVTSAGIDCLEASPDSEKATVTEL